MTRVHTGNAHRQIVDGQRVRGIGHLRHPVVFGGLIGVVGVVLRSSPDVVVIESSRNR